MIKKSAAISCAIIVSLLCAAYLLIVTTSAPEAKIIFQDDIATTAESPESAKAINEASYLRARNNLSPEINQAKPDSLADIDHDVRLTTDAAGNLIVSAAIKQLFEFYLSAIGEEPFDIILGRIQSEFSDQLPDPARTQALSLLKRYVDYKIALTSIDNETSTMTEGSLAKVDAIRQQKSRLNALRSDYFDSNEYQQFFEQEDLYDNYMLDHLSIVSDDRIDKEVKAQRLSSLEQSLPEEIRTVRADVSRYANLYETTEQMKQEGASEEAIFQQRAQTLGEDAAQAMAKLDTERRLWKQRLNNYVAERNKILSAGLSQEDKTRALNSFISHHFTDTEGLRVKALDSSL